MTTKNGNDPSAVEPEAIIQAVSRLVNEFPTRFKTLLGTSASVSCNPISSIQEKRQGFQVVVGGKSYSVFLTVETPELEDLEE